MAWIGWDLSLKEKVSGMFDIVRITDKEGVLFLEPLCREYTKTLGKPDENDDLLVSIFTKLKNPGTLLLVALKDDEPIGFLWAQPVSQFNENYLRISEIYAKQGMMGTKLFESALSWAKEREFSSVKGLVSVERAEGLQRLFKANVEAVFISVEVEND